MLRAATLALALTLPLAAALAQPVPQEIGTWRLLCTQDRITDQATCQLRHREPVDRATSAGSSSLLLEVQEREGRLVPVVMARDLTLEGAGRGLLGLTGTAQLRFPPNRYFEMPCSIEGRSIVCAPASGDVSRAAEELPRADTVLVRMTGLGTGTSNEPVELRLERTAEALSRFRAQVPEGASAAVASDGGLTLPQILDRLRRFFGQ